VSHNATAVATIGALLYPVGSLYLNATNRTNPSTLLGFGTWTAFGAGRVPVGKAAAGTFSSIGATGGEETHILTLAESPAHTHSLVTRAVQPDTNNGVASGSGGATWGQTLVTDSKGG